MMKRRVWAFWVAALAFSACVREEPAQLRPLYLSFSEAEVKTALNAGRTALQWCEGDAVSVYNDADGSIAGASYRAGENIVVEVPVPATRVKVTYPETSGSYAEPGFVFARQQTQAEAGVLSGAYYPIAAEAAIEGDIAVLHFASVGSAFALNVYNPREQGEKLQSVSVQPSGMEDAVAVRLETPFEIGADKPADKRTYAGQVYACLEKGQYRQIEFVVKTDSFLYSITSNDTPLDLESHDFFVVNLDLAHLKAYICADAGCEDFEPDGVDITLEGAFVDLVSIEPEVLSTEDILPDFSTVGYRHGDESLPDYPVYETLTPQIGSDRTEAIQAAIDRVAEAHPEGGAVLLGDGTYEVGSTLFLDRGKVVLRGESRENTVLKLTGTELRPGIVVGASMDRQLAVSQLEVEAREGRKILNLVQPVAGTPLIFSQIPVSEAYCPVGRYTIVVDNPAPFAVGSEVMVIRPHNNDWINDIGMNSISGDAVQWSQRNMSLSWTRKVVSVEGTRIRLDAPLVQALDAHYGGGTLALYNLARQRGCGVESLTIDSEYNPDITDVDPRTGLTEPSDEDHAWYGIIFTDAEDCWARNVTARHLGYAAVVAKSGARCISVENCSYVSPVSYPGGARRYGFVVESADLCLFRDCYAERAAMGFSTAGKGAGPNVFTQCRAETMRTGAGPHMFWSTGTLYDCCYNSAGFRCTDHGNSGSGHGWMGANTIFWNVETEGKIECESPWAKENTPALSFVSPYPSGRNYCIGLLGGSRVNYFAGKNEDAYVKAGYPSRPDPQWYPARVEYGAGGTAHVQLPCADAAAAYSWWPRFSISSFDHPESLYLSQLQDRRASGN